MERKTLYELIERMAKDETETLINKGEEYTCGSQDALHNFKDTSQSIGLTALQVWATFANKHWQSIMSYIRLGKEACDEPIEGRIKDLRNYLILLRALVDENKTTKPQPPVTTEKVTAQPSYF